MGSEKRQFPRTNVYCDVCIKIPVTGSLCDISRSGARLTVDDPSALPDEFMLALNTELHRWCRVVWRNDHEVGVIYMAAPAKYLGWFPAKQEKRIAPRSKAVGAPTPV
jgi:hypothetical protein